VCVSISLDILGKGNSSRDCYIPDLSARRDGRCKLIVGSCRSKERALRLMNARIILGWSHVSGCKAVKVGSQTFHNFKFPTTTGTITSSFRIISSLRW
jgi:hypothetical protein